MKLFAIALMALSFSAQASYFATFCSNARGTVKWESGHNSNTATFRTLRGKDLTLSLEHLRISFTDKTVLDVQETNVCGYYSKKETFAAKAKIIPSAENPRDLTSVSENNEIETEVICTYEINGRTSC